MNPSSPRKHDRPDGRTEPTDDNPERVICAFRGVNKSYDGKVLALDSLELDIREGELLTCLGPSGSGKTTTLMLLAGFHSQDSGEIFFRDQPIGRLAPSRRNFGVVFQSYALFPHMTVAENIMFPLKMRKMEGSLARSKVQRALEMIRMTQFADRKPAQLSGGQQQRVALARALVFDPDLVLLDEPLAALDKSLREELQLEIRQLHETLGLTMLYVTHDQSEALTLSDRIAVFNQGKIEQLAEPRNLYDAPATRFVAGFIGDMNFVPAKVVGEEGGLMVLRLSSEAVVKSVAATSIAVGTDCVIAIRPERVHIEAGRDLENSVEATVSDVIFQGNNLLVQANLADGTRLAAELHPNRIAEIARGHRVRMSWNNRDSHCFVM